MKAGYTKSRQKALRALRDIRAAFARAGITEKELQEEGRRVRRQLNARQYGKRR